MDKCPLPKESYYTLLSDKHIADTDHDHAERVFDSPNCQNNQYGDYHNLYLLCRPWWDIHDLQSFQQNQQPARSRLQS